MRDQQDREPGWYRDPEDPRWHRYWNGQLWHDPLPAREEETRRREEARALETCACDS